MKESYFPTPSQWPGRVASNGFARSWQASAWVWLTLLKNGDIEYCHSVVQSIESRLRKNLKNEITRDCSHIMGEGAFPILAAQLELKDVLKTYIKRWEESYYSGTGADILTGSSGALLAAAELEALAPGCLKNGFLQDLHGRTQQSLRKKLRKEYDGNVFLGISHGIAGDLLALELAAQRFSLPKTEFKQQIIDLIEVEKVPIIGHGAIWPSFAGGSFYELQSWCHGAPGIALAFLKMGEISSDRAYSKIANRALKATVVIPNVGNTFCCGSLGRAHILLEAFHLKKKKDLISSAKKLFRGAKVVDYQNGLFAKSFYYGSMAKIYFNYKVKNPALPLPGFGF